MKRLVIDGPLCIGCDLCVELCPDLFTKTDFVPKVTDKDVTDNQCAKDAVGFCPVNVISIV